MLRLLVSINLSEPPKTIWKRRSAINSSDLSGLLAVILTQVNGWNVDNHTMTFLNLEPQAEPSSSSSSNRFNIPNVQYKEVFLIAGLIILISHAKNILKLIQGVEQKLK